MIEGGRAVESNTLLLFWSQKGKIWSEIQILMGRFYI